jgi:hypothetical protein
MSLHLKLFQTDTEAGMDKITINCDIFLRQQHSSRLLPALYWPCFTRNIFLIQSLTHLLYPTIKNINILSPKPRKNNHFIDETIKYFKQFVLLLPTHAQFGRHTVFCMSDVDYPRAFVSFPRIAGSGNEIGSGHTSWVN